jgi:dsDNA-specific endonuclease/ATPase MutS2
MMQTQLDTQIEGLTAHLENIGLSQEQQERIAQRSRQASERATVRMQEKMRRMQEKLDRKLAEAQRRADQKARAAQRHAHLKVAGRRMWDFPMPPTPPTTPEPPGEAVSDEERLTILRMLEEKKITLEEADNLLSALEGKGS